MNKEKRIESIEAAIRNLPPPPLPMSDAEFHEMLLRVCKSSGPEEVELLLQKVGDSLERRIKTTDLIAAEICEPEVKTPPEERRTTGRGDYLYSIDEMGLLELREDFLDRLKRIFDPCPLPLDKECERNALEKIVDALPDAEKGRLMEIVQRVQLPNTPMIYEPLLTVEDHVFLKSLFPRFYEWTRILGRKKERGGQGDFHS